MKFTEKKSNNATVIQIDPGCEVICDMCNKDYTISDVKGGFMFSTKGVCPDCMPNMEALAKRYNEEKYITDRAEEGETFCNFIHRMRKKMGW